MEIDRIKIKTTVIRRYGSLATLKLCMWEDEDTVLINLTDDLDNEIKENDLLTIIKDLLR